MNARTQIEVRGTVQGVGFRPYIYSLATRRGLRGKVLNNESGVLIDLEGDDKAIDGFVAELGKDPPALSNIESVIRTDLLTVANFVDFAISPSRKSGGSNIPVAVDTSVCDDCLRELLDPLDRRFRYPFINCTNCGPRFTIIEGVPYDRERTTMAGFVMCDACRSEYDDPFNRRFHAEPIACPVCGPSLRLTDSCGTRYVTDEIVSSTLDLIQDGNIVALKSLGGYHLVCDATNAAAVKMLRSRKFREDKPFAMMARSVDVIEEFCYVSETERSLLQSRERPIVLLSKKSDSRLCEDVAPAVTTYGFMLPYTPVHHLLFEGLDRPLVMTSGNLSDEPIAYDDAEASRRLGQIADYFLSNDRPIHMRTDDSIVRVSRASTVERRSTIVLRRSRGFAPEPIRTSINFERQVLACGAELKSTFCIGRGNHAFVSHHIGDLENLETLRSYTQGIEHFKRLFDLTPEVIAYDLHPEYLSTSYAHACEGVDVKIGVQHHHAHIASCLMDNDTDGEVIGVAMDGLGFGTDGRLWGGEFFAADLNAAERILHLENVPMPGGAAAIREPWRMAVVYLQGSFGDPFVDLDLPFSRRLDRSRWRTLKSMMATHSNSPETSSMGRLFDAVSAMLCLHSKITYEGQAAIALESIANRTAEGAYCFEISSDGVIRAEPVIRSAIGDLLGGVAEADVSMRFHRAVAVLIADAAVHIRDDHGLNRVALSGGVFQNMLLLELTCELLRDRGFDTLTHSRVPTNDGGISLGQAAIANARIRSGRV